MALETTSLVGWTFLGIFLSALIGFAIYSGVFRDVSTWLWNILDKYWDAWKEFIKVHRWLQILSWLAVFLTIGNTLVPFMIGFVYICDDEGNGYIPQGLSGSLGWRSASILSSINTSWTENINLNILDYADPDSNNEGLFEKSYGIMGIGCNKDKPTFKLFNEVDIFDIQIWLLLILISYILVPLMRWKFGI